MAASAPIRAGRGYFELSMRNRQFLQGMRRFEARMRQSGEVVRALGRDLLRVFAGVGIPLAVATNRFAQFEEEMARVLSISKATGSEFQALVERAKELGRTTSFTAVEAAQGMVVFARAGRNAKEIFDSIGPSLNLARATSTDLAQTVGILNQTLNAFKLDTSQTSRIVDVLAKASNSANQTLEDVGESFKFAAPFARQMGASVEDLAAAISVLANSLRGGELAGTGFRRLVQNLAQQRDLIEEMGVEVADAEGKFRPFIDVISDVVKATAQLGDVEQLALLNKIFEARGGAAALELGTNVDTFNRLKAAIEASSGEAADMSKIMDDTLAGAMRLLRSAIEGVSIAFGETFGVSLKKIGFEVKNVVAGFTEWIAQNKELVASATLVVGVVGVLGAGLLATGLAIKFVMFSLGGLATAAGAVIAAIAAGLSLLASPIALITAAIVLNVAAWTDWFDRIGNFIAKAGPLFTELGSIFSGVLGGMSKALVRGDIEAAAEILFAGLELAFLRGTMGIRNVWDEFLFGLVDSWESTVTFLASQSQRIASLLDRGSNILENFANEFVQSLDLNFNEFFFGDHDFFSRERLLAGDEAIRGRGDSVQRSLEELRDRKLREQRAKDVEALNQRIDALQNARDRFRRALQEPVDVGDFSQDEANKDLSERALRLQQAVQDAGRAINAPQRELGAPLGQSRGIFNLRALQSLQGTGDDIDRRHLAVAQEGQHHPGEGFRPGWQGDDPRSDWLRIGSEPRLMPAYHWRLDRIQHGH